MTRENYYKLLPFRNLMAQIIINSSASNIPIEYKQILEEAGKEFGYKLSCNCSSGWFVLTSKLYKEFLAEKAIIQKEQEEKENESRKTDSSTNIKKNKRKS